MSSTPRGSRGRTRSRSGRAQASPSRQRPTSENTLSDRAFATAGRRVWGYLIDLALLLVISVTDSWLLTHWLGDTNIVRAVLLVLQLAVIVSYGAVLIRRRGATVGMRAAKLLAVDAVTCRQLSWRRVWARSATAFALTGWPPMSSRSRACTRTRRGYGVRSRGSQQ